MQQPEPYAARRQFTLRYLMLEILWIGVALGAFKMSFDAANAAPGTPVVGALHGDSPMPNEDWPATAFFMAGFIATGAAIGGSFHAMRTGALIGGILVCGIVSRELIELVLRHF